MATRSLLAAMVLGAVAVAQTQTVKPVRVESGLLQGTVEDGITIYRGNDEDARACEPRLPVLRPFGDAACASRDSAAGDGRQA